MRTERLLTCVAALGLFASFSCAAHSDQGARADSNAQSSNATVASDGKKVSVSTDGASVEVKKSGVEVKKSGEGNKSVTITANGIQVSDSDEDSQKVAVSGGDFVQVAGMNQNLSYECKGRSFNIAGTSNTVKLTGECHRLRVAGTSNQVDVEGVASITVSGIENQVTWERGENNRPPRIAKSGINNSISKKRM